MAAPMSKISGAKQISQLNQIFRLNRTNKHINLTCIYCRHVSGQGNFSGGQKSKAAFTSPTPLEIREWKKLPWRDYLTGKNRVTLENEPRFPVLLIPGHSVLPQALEKRHRPQRPPKVTAPPRYHSMLPEQDWTDVWPTAQTFKYSVIPFPVRQGAVKGNWNDGMPRAKKGNVELMKIPNFLHATPSHVKKQCQAIKKFCTAWPNGLDDDVAIRKHFPITVTTNDYVADGPTLHDHRARIVTLTVKLTDLSLDEHGRDKLLKLVGDRYNRKTDALILQADRCPMRHQNYDYTIYLLTALYNEANKIESWEDEQVEDDTKQFEWKLTEARNKLMETVKRIKHAQQTCNASVSPSLKAIPLDPTAEDVDDQEDVQEYRDALASLYHDGENQYHLDRYKAASKKILLGIA